MFLYCKGKQNCLFEVYFKLNYKGLRFLISEILQILFYFVFSDHIQIVIITHIS